MFAGVQKAFSRLLSCLKTHLEPTTFASGGACSMLKGPGRPGLGPGTSCVENGEFFTYTCSQSRHPNQVRALPQPISALGLLVLRENRDKSGKKSGNPESTNTWLPTNHAATLTTAVFFIRTTPADDRDPPGNSGIIKEWTTGRPGFNSPDLVARLASGHGSPQPQHRERGRDPMKTAVVVQRLDLSIDYNWITK